MKCHAGISDWKVQLWSLWTSPCPSITPCSHALCPQTILHPSLRTPLEQLTPGLTLVYSALGTLPFDFTLASVPLCSADSAEECGESTSSLPILAGQLLVLRMLPARSQRSCGTGQELQRAGVWGFACQSHAVCRAPTERLKGIEKWSSRTSLEVFPQHKYLYCSDVGFTSTHSTPTGRACKPERGLYVPTTCSCFPPPLLCYLLFFVCLHQGNVVSGERAS